MTTRASRPLRLRSRGFAAGNAPDLRRPPSRCGAARRVIEIQTLQIDALDAIDAIERRAYRRHHRVRCSAAS